MNLRLQSNELVGVLTRKRNYYKYEKESFMQLALGSEWRKGEFSFITIYWPLWTLALLFS